MVANAKWESGDVKELNSRVRRALRKNLCDRFGGYCAYCGIYVGAQGTIDHYVPYALGGRTTSSNLRWCCLSCNSLKGNMSPKDWEAKKPPRVTEETKHDQRVRLLAGIAQRGMSDYALIFFCLLGILMVGGGAALFSRVFINPVHCIEGYKFYGKTQIIDGEGRAIRCESVRAPERKPLT
jgi:hypothetical protein